MCPGLPVSLGCSTWLGLLRAWSGCSIPAAPAPCPAWSPGGCCSLGRVRGKGKPSRSRGVFLPSLTAVLSKEPRARELWLVMALEGWSQIWRDCQGGHGFAETPAAISVPTSGGITSAQPGTGHRSLYKGGSPVGQGMRKAWPRTPGTEDPKH